MEIEIDYMKFCLGFMWAMYLIDSYIDFRQYKCILNSTYNDLNALLKSHFKEDQFKKSQDYAKDKANFSLIKGLYSQIKQTYFIVAFLTPFLWVYSKDLAAIYGFEGEYWETCFFILVTSTLELVLGKAATL